jgi:hypothetical protein
VEDKAAQTKLISRDVSMLVQFCRSAMAFDFLVYLTENGSADLEETDLEILEQYYDSTVSDCDVESEAMPPEITDLLHRAAQRRTVLHPYAMAVRLTKDLSISKYEPKITSPR